MSFNVKTHIFQFFFSLFTCSRHIFNLHDIGVIACVVASNFRTPVIIMIIINNTMWWWQTICHQDYFISKNVFAAISLIIFLSPNSWWCDRIILKLKNKKKSIRNFFTLKMNFLFLVWGTKIFYTVTATYAWRI